MCVIITIVIVIDNEEMRWQTALMIKNPINVAFGKAIAKRREELEMTQEDLAGLVGISRASIANIEKGRQNVLLHHVYGLAEALKMPRVGDLLPARPKSAPRTVLQVNATDGSIAPRDVAQVADLVATILASHSGKARP